MFRAATNASTIRAATTATFTSKLLGSVANTTPTVPTHATASVTVRGMATKKAGGSTNNGRDSIGRRLGVKILHNQPANAGSIIVRQRGMKFRAGDNVGIGKDHTLFAKHPGIVRMEKIRLGPIAAGGSMKKKRTRNVVHVDAVAAA
eukprot:jgi/Psemu1/306419/fgenesh1_kg.256_\